jgi:vancomycin permeability regulator SanA
MGLLTGEPKPTQPADVIIVLGAAVWAGGKPSPSLQRRILHAVRLFQENRAGKLLLTGGVGKHPPAEAVVMRSIALHEGVPEEGIVVEVESKTTFESMLNCIDIMSASGWHRAIIVTDTFHIPRSVFIFRAFNINAWGSAAIEGRAATPQWKWAYYWMRELAALPWYACLVIARKIRQRYLRAK